jgi:serine/threonine-protein kinase
MSTSVPPQTRVGEVIGARYELTSLIGSGGQGHVYKAHDRKDGEAVAVKVLRHEFSHDAAWRERMLREARALTLLSNTAAVRVYDQRWTDDGAICIVMEYLEGKHFEDYLAVVESWGERLGLETLVRLIGPVVECLELAHENHILHRDIKPGNIFVRRDETVRLLDFGFAKFLHLTRMTARGFVAGSPSYIAPESWQRAPEIFDQRVDVYGLSAVIFRALAGRPPFVGDLAALAEAVTQGPRPSLHAYRPELPTAVDSWVNHALAVDPLDRFERVSGMWNAFLHTVGWERREDR